MQDRRIAKKLIDTSTGEYIELLEGDRIAVIRQNQQAAIEKAKHTQDLNNELDLWNKELGGFVFVLFKYCNEIYEQHPEITQEDITKLFFLGTYVDYNGYLVLNDSFMTRGQMRELLKINASNFDPFFNKMKRLNIFIIDEFKNIKINKEYFVKGEVDKDIKKYYDYTRVYIKTIRYLFNNVPQRKHKQLGNYFKIIPYIHRQQNVLCWNPDENKSEIQLMHVRDLQEILGCHRNSVRSFIKEMLSTRLENGQAILGFFRTEYDEGKSYIIVNPKVFYGGNFDLENGKNSVIKWF